MGGWAKVPSLDVFSVIFYLFEAFFVGKVVVAIIFYYFVDALSTCVPGIVCYSFEWVRP